MSELREEVPGDAGYEVSKFTDKLASPLGETVLTDEGRRELAGKIGGIIFNNRYNLTHAPQEIIGLIVSRDAHTRSIVISETRREVAKELKTLRDFSTIPEDYHLFLVSDFDALIRRLGGE